MGSVFRHFVLGILIGFLTIIMFYVIYNSVIISTNQLNYTSVVIVVVAYGIVTAIIGEILLKIFKKK